jgi:hypothetical protein
MERRLPFATFGVTFLDSRNAHSEFAMYAENSNLIQQALLWRISEWQSRASDSLLDQSVWIAHFNKSERTEMGRVNREQPQG